MLRHDPLAPMARAKIADWHQEADLARLRRSARQAGMPSEPRRTLSMELSSRLKQFLHHLGGLAATTISP